MRNVCSPNQEKALKLNSSSVGWAALLYIRCKTNSGNIILFVQFFDFHIELMFWVLNFTKLFFSCPYDSLHFLTGMHCCSLNVAIPDILYFLVFFVFVQWSMSQPGQCHIHNLNILPSLQRWRSFSTWIPISWQRGMPGLVHSRIILTCAVLHVVIVQVVSISLFLELGSIFFTKCFCILLISWLPLKFIWNMLVHCAFVLLVEFASLVMSCAFLWIVILFLLAKS